MKAHLTKRVLRHAQEGSFKVEIKRAFQVTTKLQWEMYMMMHLSVHKSAQNESIT